MKGSGMTELKALIIDKPENRPFHSNKVPGNFKPMIDALLKGGIKAYCRAPGSEADMKKMLVERSADIVFSAAYGIPTKNGKIKNAHQILKEMGTPFIGSPPQVLDLAINKPILKDLWRRKGVRTPGYQNFTDSSLFSSAPWASLNHFPYIIKPANAGNSRGIDQSSIVEDRKSLEKKIAEMLDEYGEVMAEEYLGNFEDFQEVTVAWIGNGDASLIMPAEIHLATKGPFPVISTHEKDAHLTRTRQVEDDALWKEIIQFSRKAFQSAGIQDYARLDIIRAHGKLFAIEINGQPMVPDRWFEACACSAGLNHEQYLIAIFLAGINRLIKNGNSKLSIPAKMERILPRIVYQLLTS